MNETRVPLDEDDIAYRNALLKQKKRGIITVIIIFVLASGFPLWFMQAQENASTGTLWIVVGIVTLLLMVALLCYVIFTRQIAQDMETTENVLVPAVVVEGWQINERRDEFLRINIGNHMVTLPMNVMKRHIDDVRDLDRLIPGSQLLVEMTPHSRVIIRIERVYMNGEAKE